MNDAPEQLLPLADGFETLSRGQWQDLVAKVVNRGRPDDKKVSGQTAEQRLRFTTVEGVTIDPMYMAPEEPQPTGYPGVMPFTRGSGHRPLSVPWGVRVFHDDPDVDVTREAVLTDMERGATSVWLEVGDHAIPADKLGVVLQDVLLDLAPVCVSSATDQAAAAEALRLVWRNRGLLTRQARGNLGLDPLGEAARRGQVPDFTGMADAVRDCLSDYPMVTALSVDMRPYHDAGAGDVDEVAFAVATGVAYLRELEEAGVAPQAAFGQIEFRINATTDEFLTIAKVRALRRVWARIGEQCGVPETQRGARIHAVSSWRMMSRDDPYVNVLRVTMACFGAAVGGADAVTALPFDTVAGYPDAHSRRIARNSQLLLAEESNVGRVIDPAGGSWYVESLTDELARAAWSAFQEIETGGGMGSALATGDVRRKTETVSAERARRLATRQLPITGVSMFPQVDEIPLQRKKRSTPSGPLDPATAGGLVSHRDTEIFERLRDRSTAYAQAHGTPPTIFLACLGMRRDFGARETFVSSLLGVAGIMTAPSEGGTTAEIASRAHDAHARIAVLCSSASRYAEEGAAVAAALRGAGVEHLYIAGSPTELGEDAGVVDGALAVGVDVVTLLNDLLDRLDAPTAEPAHAVPADARTTLEGTQA